MYADSCVTVCTQRSVTVCIQRGCMLTYLTAALMGSGVAATAAHAAKTACACVAAVAPRAWLLRLGRCDQQSDNLCCCRTPVVAGLL